MIMKKYACLILILLTGCAEAPAYNRPALTFPTQWSGEKTTAPASTASVSSLAAFNSAELNALLTKALAHNNTLDAGIQRVQQARAAVRIAGAELLPSVSASGDVSRGVNNPARGSRNDSTNIQAGVNIAYEVDLFGANRAAVIAAEAGVDGAAYNLEALHLVIMGDVANNYFTLLNVDKRLAIADANLANAREVLRITEARVNAGAGSPLELSQQKTVVSNNEATQRALIQQRETLENALAVLTGQAPQSFDGTGKESLDAITAPLWNTGQPSALLERRPDIREAEAALIAANANIAIARAAYFPSLTLGTGGNITTDGLTNPAGTALSLAASLTAPIFQGGRIEGGIEQATARQQELIATYRQTILVAFQEVEDALSALRAAEQRIVSLGAAMTEAQNAYRIARSQYDAGAIDFQTLLDTQNSVLSAENAYADVHLSQLTASVALYKALGGEGQAVNR